MVVGGEIIFRDPVAGAGFSEVPGGIDAQAAHDRARPPAPAGVALEPALRREHAVRPIGRHVTLEVPFAAEQAKAVLDLPFDARRVARGFRRSPGDGRNR